MHQFHYSVFQTGLQSLKELLFLEKLLLKGEVKESTVFLTRFNPIFSEYI